MWHALMVTMGGKTNTWVDAANVKPETAYFFVLYFLMATQDIAVDGWTLTMLVSKVFVS